MLEHDHAAPRAPARVVVLGATGFLGRALVARLRAANATHLALGSADLDLTAPQAGERLAGLLRDSDAIAFLAALTPEHGRDPDTAMRNLEMGRQVCAALQRRPCAHVVYLSSDAVYPFGPAALTEGSAVGPDGLYGAMHLTRELMLRQGCTGALAILRSTALYGIGDPHDAYGPNRFCRQAASERRIVLFGAGEETRDHLRVDDAAEVVWRCLAHRSRGLLNLATGEARSFAAVAALVAAAVEHPIEIVEAARAVPPTHRAFDPAALRQAFPDFAFTDPRDGFRALAAARRAI